MKKFSKVYEAAESVDNMPIKKTEMSHKKCTPGEFGAMVKAAVDPLHGPSNEYVPPAAAAFGSIVQRPNRNFGGLMPKPHPRLAMEPQPPKDVPGTGSPNDHADHYRHQSRMNALHRRVGPDQPYPPFDPRTDPAVINRMNHAQNRVDVLKDINSTNPPPGAWTGRTGMTKTQSAREFGAMVKKSFNLPESVMNSLPAAGYGALGGAGIGALSGLLNPGEEDEYDEDGRVIGRKPRSGFSAALRNALLGAGVGGVAGGVAQNVAPGLVNSLKNYITGGPLSEESEGIEAPKIPDMYQQGTRPSTLPTGINAAQQQMIDDSTMRYGPIGPQEDPSRPAFRLSQNNPTNSNYGVPGGQIGPPTPHEYGKNYAKAMDNQMALDNPRLKTTDNPLASLNPQDIMDGNALAR